MWMERRRREGQVAVLNTWSRMASHERVDASEDCQNGGSAVTKEKSITTSAAMCHVDRGRVDTPALPVVSGTA